LRLFRWPALVLLLWFSWRLFAKKRRVRLTGRTPDRPMAPTAGIDSEFYLIEKHLAARGVPRRHGETPGDWLARLERTRTPEMQVPPLRDILNLHYAYRFDPQG